MNARKYVCGVCKLPARFIADSTEVIDGKNHTVTAHSATLLQVIQRSLAHNVPVTHRAIPVRETVQNG